MRALSFINLNTQYENVGDALINRELINLIEPHSTAIVVNAAGCPEGFRRNLRLERPTVQQERGQIRFFWRMITARLRQQQVYWFLMPGGFHGECTGYYHLHLWRNALLIAFMSLLGARICQIGVSYERLGKNYVRLLRFRQRWLFAHRVRDEESQAYLQRLGVRCDGVSPDLSFNLFDHLPPATDPIRTVCFSFRVDQYAGQFEHARRFAEAVRDVLGQGLGYKAFAQVERDIEPGKRLARELSTPDGPAIEFAAAPSDIEACMRFYDGVDLVVTNRMHVMLMGASRCGRFVAGPLGDTNRKIFGLLEVIGRSDSGFSGADEAGHVPAAQVTQAAARILDGTPYRDALRVDVAALFA